MIICTFCRSAQNHPNASFRSDLATTLARLGVNFGQQRPNTNWLQLRPDLAPRWRPFGSKFAPSWCPYGFKMGDMTGPIRNPQDARFHYVVFSCHVFSTFLLLSMMLPMLCLRWAQLSCEAVAKGMPSCATVRTCLGPPCASYGFSLGCIRIDLDPTSAPPDQLAPTWAPVASKIAQLGPSWAPLGAARAQVEPGPTQFCGLNAKN